jgi:hypothetical protein
VTAELRVRSVHWSESGNGYVVEEPPAYRIKDGVDRVEVRTELLTNQSLGDNEQGWNEWMSDIVATAAIEDRQVRAMLCLGSESGQVGYDASGSETKWLTPNLFFRHGFEDQIAAAVDDNGGHFEIALPMQITAHCFVDGRNNPEPCFESP